MLDSCRNSQRSNKQNQRNNKAMEISIDLTAVSIDLTSADSPSSSRKRYAEDFYESKLCSKEFPVQVQPESCTKKPALQVCNQARFQDATMLSWLLIEGDDIDTRQSPSDLEWKKIVEARVPWTDPLFPPSKESVAGNKAESDQNSKSVDRIPYCRCKLFAKKATVQSDTPNKGRLYFHCEHRRCGFFAWAENRGESWADLIWKRFPSFVVVSDYGFSAKDLLQGGVGDCWFLSALAVVAERHDLVAKLFADTTPTPSGCYNIRLFLDGAWRSILVHLAACALFDCTVPTPNRPRAAPPPQVDDLLPCTARPRRPEHALDTGLAFSRAHGGQLWVCLAEKAYAKAHGSYRAISGGEIAEALLDLTGAPTATVSFDAPGFRLGRAHPPPLAPSTRTQWLCPPSRHSSTLKRLYSDYGGGGGGAPAAAGALWDVLVWCKAEGLPLGCATADDPQARLGLGGRSLFFSSLLFSSLRLTISRSPPLSFSLSLFLSLVLSLYFS
jgi:hypothetical protein